MDHYKQRKFMKKIIQKVVNYAPPERETALFAPVKGQLTDIGLQKTMSMIDTYFPKQKQIKTKTLIEPLQSSFKIPEPVFLSQITNQHTAINVAKISIKLQIHETKRRKNIHPLTEKGINSTTKFMKNKIEKIQELYSQEEMRSHRLQQTKDIQILQPNIQKEYKQPIKVRYERKMQTIRCDEKIYNCSTIITTQEIQFKTSLREFNQQTVKFPSRLLAETNQLKKLKYFNQQRTRTEQFVDHPLIRAIKGGYIFITKEVFHKYIKINLQQEAYSSILCLFERSKANKCEKPTKLCQALKKIESQIFQTPWKQIHEIQKINISRANDHLDEQNTSWLNTSQQDLSQEIQQSDTSQDEIIQKDSTLIAKQNSKK